MADHFNDSVHIERPSRGNFESKAKSYKLPEVKMLPPTEKIYQYIESRGISRKTVDDFKIQSDEKGNIVFPFYENGENVFVKFRKPEKHRPEDRSPKEWRESGTKPILFGMDMCVFSKPLVITEGEADCMALYEAGTTNVVSDRKSVV